MTTIKFGTDGWRGVIAQDFTFDNVRIVAHAIARYVVRAEKPGAGLVVGYDTRFGSNRFARAAAETVAAAGVPVALADHAAPTPAVSLLVKQRKSKRNWPLCCATACLRFPRGTIRSDRSTSARRIWTRSMPWSIGSAFVPRISGLSWTRCTAQEAACSASCSASTASNATKFERRTTRSSAARIPSRSSRT